MNHRERDPWVRLTGFGVLAVVGVGIASVLFLAPIVVGGVALAGRLQAMLLDRVLASVGGITGWQFDGESLAVRVVAASGLYTALAASLYFVFLVASNIATLLAMAGCSALLGILLTVVGGLPERTPQDYLSSLKFWDQP